MLGNPLREFKPTRPRLFVARRNRISHYWGAPDSRPRDVRREMRVSCPARRHISRATLGRRDYTAPEHVIEYRGADISWSGQLNEFVSAVTEGREPEGNGEDGLKAMELVAAAYRSSDEKLMIQV